MAPLAAAGKADGGTTVQVTIPALAVAGRRAILAWTGTPAIPTDDPAGWTPIDDSSDAPTQSTGFMYLWETTIGSDPAVDAGDVVTVTVGSAARGALVVVVDDVDGTEIIAVIPNFPGNVGNVSTLATLAGTSPGAGKLLHFYGCIGNSSATQPTWTPDGATAELADICSVAGTRNATLMVAWETLAAAGATPGRTAVPSVAIQPDAFAIVLGAAVDQPTVTVDPTSQTIVVGNEVEIEIDASGGGGAPFTYTATPDGGNPAAPPLTGATGTTPGTLSFTPSVAGVYEFSVVAADGDDVESEPVTATVTVLDGTDEARPLTDVDVDGWLKEPPDAASVSIILADNDDGTFTSYELPAGASMRVRLEPVTPPTGTEDYSMWYRTRLRSGTAAAVQLSLMQGVTVIKTWAADEWTVADIVQQFEHTLVAAEYAAVSNWNELDAMLTNVTGS